MSLLEASLSCQYWAYCRRSPWDGFGNELLYGMSFDF